MAKALEITATYKIPLDIIQENIYENYVEDVTDSNEYFEEAPNMQEQIMTFDEWLADLDEWDIRDFISDFSDLRFDDGETITWNIIDK